MSKRTDYYWRVSCFRWWVWLVGCWLWEPAEFNPLVQGHLECLCVRHATYCKWSFAYTGQCAWNSFPDDLTDSFLGLSVFQSELVSFVCW